ncbi:diphthine--ammonia ligase [Candidatus Pacearchaeota archaeon]|nr:diphthine--ammonia ligase [Candidatus Pacearchaeota archaeon]
MKLGVLFSGGKDSCLALHRLIKEGHKIEFLLSIIPKNKDSFMFHRPDFNLLKKQAEELGITLITRESKGEENEELKDLEELIKLAKDKVKGIVVGGIASNYQGDRVKKICSKLGLKFFAPLWDYEGEKIWEELLKEGFKVVIVKIACEGIPKEFLGEVIDREKFEELKKLSRKYKFRIDFEGGEAETAVLYMPGFNKEIIIKGESKTESKYCYFLKINCLN